jgi:hypothetical protein
MTPLSHDAWSEGPTTELASASDVTLEPTTDPSGEGATVATDGVAAQLAQVRAALSAVNEARARYLAVVIDQVHALPEAARHAVLTVVLREHGGLDQEIEVRALATEIGVREEGAAARMLHAIELLAGALGEVARARDESLAALGGAIELGGAVPREPRAMVRWLLDPAVDAATREHALTRSVAGLAAHALSVTRVAADVARELALDPQRVVAQAAVPAWAPALVRDARLWRTAVALAGRDDFHTRFARRLQASGDAEG